MAKGTMRYWAAAKAAAGTHEEPYEAETLAEALAAAAEKRDEEFARVVRRSSFLISGDPVGSRPHESVVLPEGGVVEVLPPFAGG
ncbi:MoaD/ThiS family protein [Actinomadura sp. BRA 177]|uniref:MoaD/ThiS family protein n=1 Tax=Actinomadura sp. BRA 177 TaxID=2745202 RepID=UPI001595F4CC|nr:MoaD/ThiS family protein [Actinomadura sp. BRA 177]NVI86293.1 MoaD/ThiS family protein [Actinomadura sp. BRA 177]